MINLDEIRGRNVYSLLEKYTGINPYIKKMKTDYLLNKKTKLTEKQLKYVQENHDREPILINKLLSITPYLGEEIKTANDLSFVPTKILVEYMLADGEKTYHVYGKLTKKEVGSKMYFLPKSQVLDDPYFNDIHVDVDFTIYNNVLAKYGKSLYEHQEKAVKFLLPRNGAILADDMGLGKTMSSIVAALESGAERILIVCTSSLKINWEREIQIFCNDTNIVSGSKWRKAKFTIINFDILRNFHTLDSKIKKATPENPVVINRELVNAKFDLVIVDEAHNLKDNKSIRGEIMVELAVKYGIEKVWLLTGTPISNRPMDFFNLLKLIKSSIADNWQYFAKRYCEGRQINQVMANGMKKKVWLTAGASNLDELHSKTKNYLLRRLKTDALDMPDKVITPLYHELTGADWLEYNALWDNYLVERKKLKKRGATPNKDLVELILLRQFIAQKSMVYTIEQADMALEMGRKVIIFTSFNEEQEMLVEHFGKKCVCHNGSMNDKQKQGSVDRFQTDNKIKVFIGNIKSAGVGITLTEATVVIFNSFDWVPGNNEQAEDRAYRIGQLNNVTVFYNLFLDTIATRMWETLKNKKSVIDNIISGKNNDEEKLESLIENMLEDEN